VTPTWVERMRPGRWYTISGDRPDLGLAATAPGTRYLIDNDPARDPNLNPPRTLNERVRRALGRAPLSAWHGTMGLRAITEAWNGAAFASRHGDSGSMVIFGGGHNDYFGSDVHTFDLASREWRRVSDGYTRGHPQRYGEGAYYPDAVYPDGSPLPPHTYDYVQYDPVGNNYLLFKGQSELGPHVRAVAIAHQFSLDTLLWRHGPKHPGAILNSGGWTTWDASRRVLWGHSGDAGGGNAFIGYCPDGVNADGTLGRWLELAPNKLPGVADHNAMQIDPERDVIIVSVHAHNALYSIDPADAQRPIARLASSGDKPRLQPYAALEYASNIRRLVYFSALDRGSLYTIAGPEVIASRAGTIEEWVWQIHAGPTDALDPIADAQRRSRGVVNSAHVFGRFRIASFGGIDIAILVRHLDSPVYALRLNG